MEYIKAGQFIRELRKRKGMSQEELCMGLCEPPTMSKIEKGRQYPNKKLLDALLVRLQEQAELQVPLSAVDFERAQIEREAVSRIANREYDIMELAARYRECSPMMNNHEQQFYRLAQALYLAGIEKNWTVALDAFETAIRLTMPNYTVGTDINANMLTSMEFTILNNIAICLWFLNQKDEAIDLMEQLYEILDTYEMDREEYAKRLPMTAYNLSTWLGIRKEYKAALCVAEEGIECCIKYGKYASLGDLLYNKGFTLLCLGAAEQAKPILQRAFMHLLACNKTVSYGNLKKDLTDSFGTEVWADIMAITLPEDLPSDG
ncbi:MAG: helix-turn-helix transcriptional regulator [Treponema sp.]|nr:helix-turn-helix transcriptional regulator [Treponema sp.]MCR5621929.1 helix-turn-helix transcriptional regulator [Treponema sp.]